MIRVYKNPVAPPSLPKKLSWNHDDVVAQLREDQHCKCYLCERKLITAFQVDHLQSRHNFPRLIYEWSNLFLCCFYCNCKKSDHFDNILNPALTDIEDLITQKMDFPNAKAVFTNPGTPSPQTAETIRLLSRIFNGTTGIRNIREQAFYDYAKSKISDFQALLLDWLETESPEAEQAIMEELSSAAEFTAFKRHLIRINPRLRSRFAPYLRPNYLISK